MRKIPYMLFIILLLVLPVSAKSIVYEEVAIKELVNNPDKYNGKPVAITGVVKSIIDERGRMGSEFVVYVIGFRGVYVDCMVGDYAVRINHVVTVLGIYNKTGRFGGRTFSHFIVVRAIM